MKPFGNDLQKASSVASTPVTSSSAFIDVYISSSYFNSLQIEIADLLSRSDFCPTDVQADVKLSQAEAFLGEESGSNKRAHVEDENTHRTRGTFYLTSCTLTPTRTNPSSGPGYFSAFVNCITAIRQAAKHIRAARTSHSSAF